MPLQKIDTVQDWSLDNLNFKVTCVRFVLKAIRIIDTFFFKENLIGKAFFIDHHHRGNTQWSQEKDFNLKWSP